MEFLITGLSSALIMIVVRRLNKENYFDRPELTFTDEGEFVRVRSTSYARFYKTKGRLIKKSHIVKIQKAGCLSIFYKSTFAIDISVHPKNRDKIFEQAKSLFKNAEPVEIDMTS
ncbi:hypothetical protein P886_1262 [Alteromonadaceae bacterium 2753L.S.0a.02]|nr:hypothetical protein P886_1262 [Alteromonadaceae bacterium 2753L.S.0a.02]